MRSSQWCRWLLAGSIAAGCLFGTAGPLRAVEDAQGFLDGLRELGYFDTALLYLEQVRTNPIVGKDFKDTIDYEAGVTLIDASRVNRQMSAREGQLAEAREKFQKFLTEHPKHPAVASARTQLANLLVERGQIKTEQAGTEGTSAAEKKTLMDDARKLYRDAETVFAKLEAEALEAHKKYPKFIEQTDTEKIAERDQVRKDLLTARLALAGVVYKISQTYDPGSDENKKSLEDAAKKYYELFEKYGTRIAGLYARMWEGRCYKELGKTKEAFEAFADLMDQPDEPQAFRDLKNKTLILYLETLKASKKHDEAIKKFKDWQEIARGPEEINIEGLAIQFLAGDVYLQYGRSLKEKKDVKTRNDIFQQAHKLFKHVARFPGEYQKQARSKLNLPEFGEGKVLEPTDFAQACDRARDALDRTQDTNLSPEEAAEARKEAIKYYRMAIEMKTPEQTHEDMNLIRYYLSYLYWLDEDAYRAAITGEFLARRYPEATGARPGSRIAMAAWVKLYNDADAWLKQAREELKLDPAAHAQAEMDSMTALSDFYTAQMVDVAQYVTKRWAGEPEADEAWLMLIRSALMADDLQKSQEYLPNVSPESPRRGEIELMVGQKLWAAYLAEARKPEDESATADQKAQRQAKTEKMLADAQQTLSDGIQRMRKSVDDGAEVSYTLAASVLSLTQICIGANQPAKAVELLEDEKIGALTLVAANNPVTERGSFRVQTYKAALRAYVADQKLQKAEDAMEALEELIKQSGDAEAGKKLTIIYISLGRELQDQLQRLQNQGKAEDLAKVSQGFELFLQSILKRDEGNTFSSLNWVAETFVAMGAGFDPGGTGAGERAKSYYANADAAYQKILELCMAKKIEFQPGAITSIQIRRARCLRRLGNYKEALKILVAVLKEKNTMVDAQVEAAYTYQAQGKENPTGYGLAIKGGTTQKEIWGWGTIARRVARSKPHRSIFHEARYNLALCRFELAVANYQGKKRELLERAKNDILIILRLYPKMGEGLRLEPGGKDWKEKYNDLFIKVQKLQGVKKPLSLDDVKAKNATPSK